MSGGVLSCHRLGSTSVANNWDVFKILHTSHASYLHINLNRNLLISSAGKITFILKQHTYNYTYPHLMNKSCYKHRYFKERQL